MSSSESPKEDEEDEDDGGFESGFEEVDEWWCIWASGVSRGADDG